MPRESVTCEGDQVVQVGWGDGTVQLGVGSASGRSLLTTLYGGDDEALRRVADAVLAVMPRRDFTGDVDMGREILDAVEASARCSFSDVWASATRDEVNRLIRLLRRARDRSYGADA